MGPRSLRRSVVDEILQVLGDSTQRGDRLLETLADLGARFGIDPFRHLLDRTFPQDPASEARESVAAIERHRADLEAILGRDPGFVVAALDRLEGRDGPAHDRVFREGETVPADATASGGREPSFSFHEALRSEVRRMERSGRSLALVVVSADASDPASPGTAEGCCEALRDHLRDTDFVAPLPEGEVAVILPCTSGEQGLVAARRLLRSLLELTGVAACAGVAAADGPEEARTLMRNATRARVAARRTAVGVVLHRSDRRSHSRLQVDGRLSGRLRSADVESEVRVIDLSLGGAMLSTPGHLETDSEVVLALPGAGARPVGYLIPSRVVRAGAEPGPGRPPWRAAVRFGTDARDRIAAILAGLDESGVRRAP